MATKKKKLFDMFQRPDGCTSAEAQAALEINNKNFNVMLSTFRNIYKVDVIDTKTLRGRYKVYKVDAKEVISDQLTKKRKTTLLKRQSTETFCGFSSCEDCGSILRKVSDTECYQCYIDGRN